MNVKTITAMVISLMAFGVVAKTMPTQSTERGREALSQLSEQQQSLLNHAEVEYKQAKRQEDKK